MCICECVGIAWFAKIKSTRDWNPFSLVLIKVRSCATYDYGIGIPVGLSWCISCTLSIHRKLFETNSQMKNECDITFGTTKTKHILRRVYVIVIIVNKPNEMESIDIQFGFDTHSDSKWNMQIDNEETTTTRARERNEMKWKRSIRDKQKCVW